MVCYLRDVCPRSSDRSSLVQRPLVRRFGPGICRVFGASRLARPLDVEEVADALECLDPARLARLCAELPADSADPYPEVLEIVSVFGPPNLRQQLGVEDDLARVSREVLKQQPFGP